MVLQDQVLLHPFLKMDLSSHLETFNHWNIQECDFPYKIF